MVIHGQDGLCADCRGLCVARVTRLHVAPHDSPRATVSFTVVGQEGRAALSA